MRGGLCDAEARPMEDLNAIREKKAGLEAELAKTEQQIYELEGEYLQARKAGRTPLSHSRHAPYAFTHPYPPRAGDREGRQHPSRLGRISGQAGE